MPFTLSHAVLAPPLSRLTGGRLPTAALAIGCMVPGTFAFKEALSQPIMLLGQAYPLHRILQIGCSIAALPLIGWMSWRYYQSYQQHLPVSLKIRRFAWGLALASLGAGALQAWLFNISPSSQLWRTDLYEITGRLLNEFAHGSLLMFSLGCLLFAVLDRGHRMG